MKFSFLKLNFGQKYLRKVFETPLNDNIWQNVMKFTHLSSKEAENKKCNIKCVFRKTFKKLYKTIKEFIFSNLADLFDSKSTQRALGYTKCTRGTLKGPLGT